MEITVDADTLITLAGIVLSAFGVILVLVRMDRSTRAELGGNIDGLRTELKGETAVLRTELKSEIAGSRDELGVRIDGVRTELKGEISGSHDELGERIDGVRTDLKADLAVTRVELKQEIQHVDDRVYALASGLRPLVESVRDGTRDVTADRSSGAGAR